MSANNVTLPSPPAEEQPHNHQEVADKPVATSPIYDQLIDIHLKRRRVDEKGNQRPEQSLKNELSVIRDWCAFFKLSPSDAVGEELGIRFNECISSYISDLTNPKGRNLSEKTARDRKTIINKLRQSSLELKRTGGLHEDFAGSLKSLIKMAGISVRQLARKSGTSHRVLIDWAEGAKTPSAKSLQIVRKLEKALKVLPGTLSSRLPDAHWSKQRVQRGTTAWRAHMREMAKLVYRLLIFTPLLEGEWGELLLFFTDDEWAYQRGLNTNSRWRIRWNNKICVTGNIYLGYLRSFFGYLRLPVTGKNEIMIGLGFDLKGLTLALLTDADLVINFLHFMKRRTVSDSFNGGTVRFIGFCMMLMRNKTGYLRQRPEFGAKLPQPIEEEAWDTWCEKNRSKLKEFQEKISPKRKGRAKRVDKKNRVIMTRNPFEPVMDIINERQHPISAIFDLTDRLESLTPMMERGAKVPLAIHRRSLFQLMLIGSNPLRSENFSMMTHLPKDHYQFERAREIYRRYRNEKRALDLTELRVETDEKSNLYQTRDGSWRLRFNEEDFKNERGEDIEAGVLHAKYDVPVVPEVWPSLAEYLFMHRPVLNEALRDTLKCVRAERGLRALTPDEELAIMLCGYVFRPGPSRIFSMSSEKLKAGYGTGQMPASSLSFQILYLTSRFLRESKGFCANACRHLVATEYIKNEPDGWDVAAEALHNTAATVRKHYAWVVVADRIKPWNDHYGRVKRMHDRGEL